MAALMSLTQISNGNPVYETLYRQLDPGNLGKVGAPEAAQFLKRSGLSDITLVKIWDLSDPDRKGYLDKRGFFFALRLVASAQSGGDVSQAVLSQAKSLPAPKFRDTGSPSLMLASSSDPSWAVKFDEKAKYDGIFESLSPVNGLLSGDKVKPVLINSNLPLDVLGKIWDLSDIDMDGHLDKEEFAVAMHLVYRAREKEPVPSILPASIIPPSKRKKNAVALAGSVPVLPSSPFLLKENLRSTVPRSKSPLTLSSNLSPSNSFRSSSPAPQMPASTNWVVPQGDKEQYEEIFDLADSDFDGMVGGGEVKDIFINSGLPQTVLAQIWSLADTKSVGKLTKEQFCLAMHLIQQTVKGADPPQSLNADMIPPSERGSAASTAMPSETSLSSTFDLAGLSSLSREISSPVVQVEFTGNKELDDISQEIAHLQSEKHSMEQETRHMEEALRQKNSELHRMKMTLEQENSGIKELEKQTQSAQSRLQEMEQQRSKLESTLTEAKSKLQEESNKISSLQTQVISKETNQQMQEKELSKAKTDLYCLEQEEKQLEESLLAGKAKLESILKLLKTSQNEMDEVQDEISQINEKQKELNKTIERFDRVLKGSTVNLVEIDKILAEEGSEVNNTVVDSSFKTRLAMFDNGTPSNSTVDPFQTEDPFKSDPFNKADPFGGDPFKQSDPFRDPFGSSDHFTKTPSSQLKASPFGRQGNASSISPSKLKGSDPFAPSAAFDSFGGSGGFADFGSMSKASSAKPATRKPTYPLPPPKKPTPGRAAPPPYGTGSAGTHTGVAAHRQTLGVPCFPRTYEDSLSSSQPSRSALTGSLGLADLKVLGNEVQQLEWAKRESKREEDRLRRLRLQEQQDLELALALSRVDMSRT